MTMGSRPFRVGLPTLPSTQRPQPRQVMTSPAAIGLSGFRQTVWFTCTAPRWMASAALPRLTPKPADATPSSRREATVSRTSVNTGACGARAVSDGSAATVSRSRPAESQLCTRCSATDGSTITWQPPSVNSISPIFPLVNPRAIRLPKKSRCVRLLPLRHRASTAVISCSSGASFQSGRNTDKFAGQKVNHSDNGLVFLDKYINAFMSLKVEQYVDLGTHGMFICSVTEARVVSDQETMSYTYYQKNVKPKPETEGKKGFVCKVCGYIYEGDELPEDIICPLCKHGAVDFEPIEG